VPTWRVDQLLRPSAPDVCERDGDDHAGDVLDGEESQRRVAHRGREVAECLACERTQENVQDQSEQQLQIEAAGEPRANRLIAGQPLAATGDAANRAHERRQRQRQYEPAQCRVNQQECGIHSRILLDRSNWKSTNRNQP